MGRIPDELQAIFLASNGGQEVHTPPPNRSAFKVFKTLFSKVGKRRGPLKGGILSDIESVGTVSTLGTTEFNSGYDFAGDVDTSGISGPVSPHEQLVILMKARGYRTERYPSLESSLFNRPTPLQLASYDTKMVDLLSKNRNEHQLGEILSAGVSPNACNIHGETLMHKVCRSGSYRLLKVFVKAGAVLKIADAQGRTLLHDTCWGKKPAFETFSLLVQQDPVLLFMTDCRGACPLEYVRKEHYELWIDFLSSRADQFWPPLNELPPKPAFVLGAPHSCPIPDPKESFPLNLVSMVASGRVSPSEMTALLAESESSDGDYEWDSDDFSDDDSSEESESDHAGHYF